MAKAKDGSECFTRQNKAGGKYVTCKGTQGDSKATKASARPAGKGGKAKRTGGAPGKKAKPAAKSKPLGYSPPASNISPDSARAKARRAPVARKLTTRPAAAGRIETGTLNKGKIIKASDTKDTVYEKNLKEFGITRPVKGNEVRLMTEKNKTEKFISSSNDDEFIKRVLKLSDWTTQFAAPSAAQRKRILQTRGRNDIFIRPDSGVGSSEKRKTVRMLDIIEFKEGVKGRMIQKHQPKILFKYLGNK